MHDVVDDRTDESAYECLGCGRIVSAPTHPGDCGECDGMFQSRGMSLE